MVGLARSIECGRQDRPRGRWEGAQVAAWGPGWTDIRGNISALIGVVANSVVP